jgi:hypothetical protein
LAIDASAPRPEVDAAPARRVSDPLFCATRDGRRPIALHELYLDLPRSR